MPVVSDDNCLLGIVTVDDALDVLEEEHAEDLQIVGGGRSDSDLATAVATLFAPPPHLWSYSG